MIPCLKILGSLANLEGQSFLCIITDIKYQKIFYMIICGIVTLASAQC